MKAKFIKSDKKYISFGQVGDLKPTCNPEFVLFMPDDGVQRSVSHKGFMLPTTWFEVISGIL